MHAAHKKYYDAGILHGCVTKSNIMICEGGSDDNHERRGVLIDLDRAIRIDSGASTQGASTNIVRGALLLPLPSLTQLPIGDTNFPINGNPTQRVYAKGRRVAGVS